MTFEEWCEENDWYFGEDSTRSAWDHQQQRIDAHNERCKDDCENKHCMAVDVSLPAFQCEHCPRRYMIED